MLENANVAREGGAAEGASVLSRALAKFGHSSLRPGQAEVIADIFAGKQVIAVMPTGAGKSLCYQLPAIAFAEKGGVTLVVSPLIALMKDQVDVLRARGVAAVALTSQASAEEQRDMLDGIRAGAYTLVYVAPERFRSPRFVDALSQMAARLALIAIDEAHCISEWGHDFRPDYRRIGEAVRALAAPRVAAFTATATPEVRDDIAVQLGFTEPRLHVRGFDRPNLGYEVRTMKNVEAKAKMLAELVRTREGGVALVYASTRKNAERYAAELKGEGMRARVYHAGLEDTVREKAQDVFMSGQLDVIVATNAFGMGVDKSDIRLVVHADIPRSPEAYYQEAGRGGRDGKPTRCVLLFSYADVRLQEFLIAASFPSAEVLRGLWRVLRDRPELGRLARGVADPEEELEGRLKKALVAAGLVAESSGKSSWGSSGGGNNTATSGAAIGSAIRILERHGMLRWADNVLVATRPEPNSGVPVLDVAALQRRSQVELGKLRTMAAYAYHPRCRRQFVLEYFGDEAWRSRERMCGACDNCIAIVHGKQVGLSKTDVEAVRALLVLVGALGGRFGKTKIAAIATGSETDPRYYDVPSRASLRGWSDDRVKDLLRNLEGVGLVESARGEYPTIATTRKGDQVAAGHLDPNDLGIEIPEVGGKRKKGGGGGGWKRRRS